MALAPAEMNSELSVCNEALLRLGEPPMDTLDDAGTAGTACRVLLRPLLDELLGGHPWSFNRRLEPLPRAPAAPLEATGYNAAFLIPAGCLRIVAVHVSGWPVDSWDRAGDALLCDVAATQWLDLEYHARCDPPGWTPAFREAVVATLAARLAIPIADDTARAGALQQQAQVALAKARHQNAAEKPAPRLQLGRLSARMRRG